MNAGLAVDLPQLADGIGFVVVAMGMFGLAEIIRNLEEEQSRSVMVSKITNLNLERHTLAAEHVHGSL